MRSQSTEANHFRLHLVACYSDAIIFLKQFRYIIIETPTVILSVGFRWWGPGAQAWWEAPCANTKCLGRG